MRPAAPIGPASTSFHKASTKCALSVTALALARRAYEGGPVASLVGRNMGARPPFLLATVIGLWALLAGCSSTRTDSTLAERTGDATVTVGSFGFAESRLLAELYSQALEQAGYPVQRAFDLG